MANAGNAPRRKNTKGGRTAAGGAGAPQGGRGTTRAARGRGKTPFGKSELARFKELLLDRRRRILSSVSSMEEEALKAADQDFSVDHMADHGSDNFEQDLTLGLVEGELKELAEIDRALHRVANGTYGICLGTGEPIGKPRLEAIPWARYSVEHQRAIEAGTVTEGDDEEEEGNAASGK